MKKFLFKNYGQFVALFWVFLFVAFLCQFLPQTSVVEALVFPLIFLSLAYPFATYLSKTLLLKAVIRKKTVVFLFQFLLFSVIIGFLFFSCALLFVFLENKGIFPESNLFGSVEFVYYNTLVFITAGIFINLCFCGLRFFEENLKLQKTLFESQIQMLQDQITPHFMFNVLNHIHVLMQSDVDLASSLLIKYSDILRYQLYSGKKEFIFLEQEVEFLRNFIDIEKIRWADKLSVNCSWKIDNGKKEIPPLLLVTFIENAFKHVSRTNLERDYVDIDFEQKDGIISLAVKNSKSTMPTQKNENSGLGLENAKKRLDILYHKNYVLSIKDSDTDYCLKLTINV